MGETLFQEQEEYTVSADGAMERVYREAVTTAGASTLFDRWRAQQPQCRFGQEGVCCHICGMGPCRITPKADRGICGATADTIVARNLLRHIVAGTAAYVHHAKRAASVLKKVGEEKTSFKIKDRGKLEGTAQRLGIKGGSPEEMALDLAEAFFDGLNAPVNEQSLFVKAFAPKKRLEVWEKLGVIPGGVQSEILESMTRTMTHINTDPVELLLNAMRLSIASAYMGLLPAVTFQDILLGTPRVTTVETNLGCLDPETVNILVHGHQPLLVAKVVEHAGDRDLLRMAEEAGAKGIKVYGSTDVGQELLAREGMELAGQIGSWMKQEFAVATGVVDLMILDFNCTIPGLKAMADRFHTRLISVEPVLRLEGVETKPFDPERADEDATGFIKMAIEAYKKRGEKVSIPDERSTVFAGFTAEAVVDLLGADLRPLIDAIASGRILGVAAVVGCTNPYKGRQDLDPLILTEELVARDILVLSSGCCASDIQHSNIMTPEGFEYCGRGLRDFCYSLGIPPVLSFGSCTEIHRIVELVTVLSEVLNVDTKDLPVAVSAPEWMDEKSLADGLFAVAFGLFTHVAPSLPIDGSSRLRTFLTHRESKRKRLRPEPPTILDITGGEFAVETDPVKAANLIEYHIAKRRERLI